MCEAIDLRLVWPLVLVLGQAAGHLPASPPELDYDQLEINGLELLVNGSFERAERQRELPADLGVPQDVRDRLQMMTDVRQSKHGTRFIRFQPDRLRQLYARLKRVPSGRCRVSIWARGQGQLSVAVGVVRRGAQVLARGKKFLARMVSPRFDVAQDEWTEYKWEFDVAPSYTVDGKQETPESVQLTFGVVGDVCLDQCSVVSLSEEKEVLARREASGDAATVAAGLLPVFTMPRLAEAPALDIELIPENVPWSGMAAVTGFCGLKSGPVSGSRTVVFACRDAQRLYFVFRSSHEGPIRQIPSERDGPLAPGNERVEVWLQPPGRPWFRFAIDSAGSVLDANQTQGLAWNGNWQHHEQIDDVPEEIGGILSFRRKRWTAKIAIPFAGLGVAAPQDGEVWRINFLRNEGAGDAAAGQASSESESTTWSPAIGRADDVERFGSVVFRSDAPAVQLLGLGDVANGDLSIHGARAGGQGPLRVVARAALSDSNKTVSLAIAELPEKTAETPFSLANTLKLTSAADVIYRVTVQESATGRRLAELAVPLTATAALRVKVIPVFADQTLFVHADASQSANLNREVTVGADLWRGDAPTGRSASTVWERGRQSGDVSMSLAGLPAGEYQVKAWLKPEAESEPAMSSTARFTIPETPEWIGNRIGEAGDVSPPWHPVRVDGNRVEVTEREYTLGPMGLPDQIRALGEDLMASPPRLRATVDGRVLAWKAEPPRLAGRNDAGAAWQLRAAAGPLALTGTLSVEFDGFALWSFSISADSPTRVDSLAIEFPIRKERSLYARGRDATLDDRGTFAAMLNRPGRGEDVVIAGGHFSPAGWIWPDQWCHEIWLGDDERGLAVMCETQEHLKGKLRTEIVPGPEANTLRIHLASRPFTLDAPLPYVYAWQATPVKPRPDNPKLWHATYRRGQTDEALRDPGVPDRIGVTLDMWGLKFASYPALFRSRRATGASNGWLQERGTKVVPYFGTNMTTLEAAELAPFRAEWEAWPAQTGENPRGRWYRSCPQSAHVVDFLVDAAKRVVDDLGYDGLYLDVSACSGCMNPYHGCGYRDAETGPWRQTVPILANRRLYKRLYRLFKSDGRDAWIFRHGMPVAAVAGFVDVVTQGEDWCREQSDQYDRMTPDIFRTREARIQYGTPYTWYTFHHYYRGEKFGGRVPLAAILAYTLPHRVLPTAGHQGMWPVWDAVDRFWTDSDFLPSWSPQSPIRIDAADVVGSVYLRREAGEALLVVANWSTEPRSAEVAVDAARLGMDQKRLKFTRALEHPILGPDDAPETDRMPNSPLDWREGRLHVDLQPRNLEVLLLTSDGKD